MLFQCVFRIHSAFLSSVSLSRCRVLITSHHRNVQIKERKQMITFIMCVSVYFDWIYEHEQRERESKKKSMNGVDVATNISLTILIGHGWIWMIALRITITRWLIQYTHRCVYVCVCLFLFLAHRSTVWKSCIQRTQIQKKNTKIDERKLLLF